MEMEKFWMNSDFGFNCILYIFDIFGKNGFYYCHTYSSLACTIYARKFLMRFLKLTKFETCQVDVKIRKFISLILALRGCKEI